MDHLNIGHTAIQEVDEAAVGDNFTTQSRQWEADQ